MSYTFAINKIILAMFLAVILVGNVRVNFPYFDELLFKIVTVVCTVLSLVGFAFLLKQQLFNGRYHLLTEFFLFQSAYVLSALVLLGRSFEADWAIMKFGETTNA
ncbi:MAG: hypothetical protein ACPGVT_09245 [Maricaulaceae bacterium]